MTSTPMYSFTVNNQYAQTVVAYSTMSEPVTDPPSMDADAYYPIYTTLGTVDANGTSSFSTPYPLARIVLARASDEFPLLLAIVDVLDPSTQTVTVTAADEQVTDSAWAFYQTYSSQPYQPLALQFNEILIDNTDPTQLDAQVAAFFSANGYPGVDLGIFSTVAFWATNSLYACPGTYWCYEPQSSVEEFVLPTTPSGMLTIENGTATYTPSAGTPQTLLFARSQLATGGATPIAGIQLTGILRDLAWEGQPDTLAMCFVGTNNGAQMIAQPYENPSLPWYAIAYDMVYGTFFMVQVVMALNMAVHVLKGVTNGLQYLASNVGKLFKSLSEWANNLGQSAGPDSGLGEDVDPINVDVDVDVDIDVDVDVDVDIDIDVDVDVDIDIDVDVDFVAVVDVDVDIDIDIDIDVVTDTDTDIDIDVDVDVDTDVNVEPGMTRSLLNKLGSWIMTKGAPALLQFLVVSFAFASAAELLQAWKDADEEAIENLQPRESTGLGLLINYMFNESVTIQARWDTFADYVQQAQADVPTTEMLISMILMAGDQAEDTAAANWRWSTADENAAVAAMAQYTGSNMYKAFQTLGAYTYQNQVLPVKVGAEVAMQYLKEQ